jgi:molybdate transport system substrate-binding protein
MLATSATFSTSSTGTAAEAAEVKVLCSNGLRAVIQELISPFERATTHKVVIVFDPATALKKRIDAGEAFDLAVLTPGVIDDEIKAGRIGADSRTVIARSGLGLMVRAGARKPDLSTVETFKRALLSTKSLTWAREGATNAPFLALIDRLGVAGDLKPKIVMRNTGAEVGAAVAGGQVELGVLPVSEILPTKGAELAGAFPADIQSYVVMVAGVGANAKERAAARELIQFLTAPANLPVIKAKGMER